MTNVKPLRPTPNPHPDGSRLHEIWNAGFACTSMKGDENPWNRAPNRIAWGQGFIARKMQTDAAWVEFISRAKELFREMDQKGLQP